MAAPKFQSPRTETRTVSSVVRTLFDEIKQRRIHMADIAAAMSMSRVGLYSWRVGRTTPNILSVEELAEELGYRLKLEPIEEKSDA